MGFSKLNPISQIAHSVKPSFGQNLSSLFQQKMPTTSSLFDMVFGSNTPQQPQQAPQFFSQTADHTNTDQTQQLQGANPLFDFFRTQ